jgi:shikimate kinase
VKPHVALVGFMGAGKSTLGRRLACVLQRPFIDTDAEIAAATGMRIVQLFEREGETAFRRREEAVLRIALAGQPAVIALGGGTQTDPISRALVTEHAVRVYLFQDLQTLHARLTASRTIRPVLGRAPRFESIKTLFGQREPLYREAEIVVERPVSDRDAIAAIITALEGLKKAAEQPNVAS